MLQHVNVQHVVLKVSNNNSIISKNINDAPADALCVYDSTITASEQSKVHGYTNVLITVRMSLLENILRTFTVLLFNMCMHFF